MELRGRRAHRLGIPKLNDFTVPDDFPALGGGVDVVGHAVSVEVLSRNGMIALGTVVQDEVWCGDGLLELGKAVGPDIQDLLLRGGGELVPVSTKKNHRVGRVLTLFG